MAVFVLIVSSARRVVISSGQEKEEALEDLDAFDERKHTDKINIVLSKLQDKGAKIISITPFVIPWPTYGDSFSPGGPVGYLIAYESARTISIKV